MKCVGRLCFYHPNENRGRHADLVLWFLVVSAMRKLHGLVYQSAQEREVRTQEQ
jgi:hypothetical protein